MTVKEFRMIFDTFSMYFRGIQCQYINFIGICDDFDVDACTQQTQYSLRFYMIECGKETTRNASHIIKMRVLILFCVVAEPCSDISIDKVYHNANEFVVAFASYIFSWNKLFSVGESCDCMRQQFIFIRCNKTLEFLNINKAILHLILCL